MSLYILANTTIRTVGHGAVAGTIVAYVYPHLPLTFIVGATAVVTAAGDLRGWPSLSEKPTPLELTSGLIGGSLCVLCGPGSIYAPVSWNVGKFLVGGFLMKEIYKFGALRFHWQANV